MPLTGHSLKVTQTPYSLVYEHLVLLFSQPDKGGVDGGAPKWKTSRVNYSEVLILTNSSNPLTGLFSGGLLGLGAFADPSLIVALCCISLVAVGNSCNNAPVCCDDVSQSGLIGVGCSPVNLSL
ncbi:hypothetical protein BC827DRAFT_1267829 [Russula dissimulans]|nr:hypothetical protein BC827DRAFT_1267829 [Russula dissimulans]